MHPHEADLQALLDGALDPAEAATARTHLAGCAACASRLAEIEAMVRFNRAALDALEPGPLPDVTADDVIALARARQPVRSRAFLKAAGVAFLLAAAGAAAAWPGSPVREAAVQLVEGLRSSAPPPLEPAPAASEVALQPTGGLVVAFAASQAEGAIEIAVESTGTARVQATDPAVSFSVGVDSIAVENAGSTGSYRVVVPRSLTRVEVRVGDAVVLSIAGDDVRSAAPLVEGSSILPFSSID